MPCQQSVTLHNGVSMPLLGLGVWKSGAGEETENAVLWAIKAGYRHIDTAAVYKNEESVGKAIATSGVPREALFVTTKLWNADQGYESVLKAFDTSLKKLGLTYVDLYLIHWPGRNKYLETWSALERLYEEKKVRAIGVSNFQQHHIEEVLRHCKVAPMVNQVELHPLNNQRELREYCKSKNIAVTAWSPLGQGNLLADPTLKTIAGKYGKTPAQVLLRWDLQHNVITIPKSVHEDRIVENSKVFDFELAPEDMKTIDGMNTNSRYGPNPDEFMLGFE